MNKYQKHYLERHSSMFDCNEETYQQDMKYNYIVLENGDYRKPLRFGNGLEVVCADIEEAKELVTFGDKIITEEDYFNIL